MQTLCTAQHKQELQLWKRVSETIQKMEGRMDKSHQKLRKELKEGLLQITSVQTRGPVTRSRHPTARGERVHPKS